MNKKISNNDLNTEEKILHAAMDLFIEKGRHGAKMQEIADRAGINKSLLHYYFRSKEKLFASAFSRIIQNSITGLVELLHTALPFREFLRRFIVEYIDMVKRDPRIPLFLMREFSEGGESVRAVFQEMMQRGDIDVTPLIQKINMAVQNGEIAEVDPWQLIATVVGACILYFISEPMFRALIIDEDNFNRDEFIEERKEAIFKVIYNGIKQAK